MQLCSRWFNDLNISLLPNRDYADTVVFFRTCGLMYFIFYVSIAQATETDLCDVIASHIHSWCSMNLQIHFLNESPGCLNTTD